MPPIHHRCYMRQICVPDACAHIYSIVEVGRMLTVPVVVGWRDGQDKHITAASDDSHDNTAFEINTVQTKQRKVLGKFPIIQVRHT
jgi:hypothetical protein